MSVFEWLARLLSHVATPRVGFLRRMLVLVPASWLVSQSWLVLAFWVVEFFFVGDNFGSRQSVGLGPAVGQAILVERWRDLR